MGFCLSAKLERMASVEQASVDVAFEIRFGRDRDKDELRLRRRLPDGTEDTTPVDMGEIREMEERCRDSRWNQSPQASAEIGLGDCETYRSALTGLRTKPCIVPGRSGIIKVQGRPVRWASRSGHILHRLPERSQGGRLPSGPLKGRVLR